MSTCGSSAQHVWVGVEPVYGQLSPMSLGEPESIGRAFDVPQMANMLEGGRTPILRPAELEALGFRIVIYGISLLMRITRTMQEALADIASGELKRFGSGVSFEEYKRVIGFARWAGIEDRYGRAGKPGEPPGEK